MKKYFFIAVLILYGLSVSAHPWKTNSYVVIDTDCGIDDFRAINMMLSSSSVRVLGIIASDGVVNAGDGYYKIRQLLVKQYHEGILTGINDDGESRSQKSCNAAEKFQWSDKNPDSTSIPSYKEVMKKILAGSSEKITFVSLGSLETINSLIQSDATLKSRIKNIVWTAGCSDMEDKFNYKLSPDSYMEISHSGIPLYIININEELKYSGEVIKEIESAGNICSESILQSFQIKDSPFAKVCYDEMAALYIHSDSLFASDTLEENVMCVSPSKENTLSYIPLAVKSKNTTGNQVLASFPVQPEDYYTDVGEILNAVYNHYGPEEWQACVITSELHRHLGVYSITGAKMGIRALEYFGAGVDEMSVVSHAGTTPPFSCLNDGLQVSTGATLGHGLIKVAGESLKLPQAEFTYLNQTIIIKLKDEYRQEIEKEVKELVMVYTLDSNIYWDLIRQLALRCWKDWNRHEVFEIEIK
jgi:inosine-uridine nucleoside N-ribohydrolase/formylmethanofuran dehydrogenase subunit E